MRFAGPVSKRHDVADRLTAVTYPTGSVTYTHDALGRETAMMGATGVTTKTYDAASRVTSVAAPGGTVSYSYNNAGQHTGMTLPGSRAVSYGYDTGGRLASLTDWAARVTSFAYNTNDWRTAINHPNAVTSAFGYDAAGQVPSINHAGPGGSLLAPSHGYDEGHHAAGFSGHLGLLRSACRAIARLSRICSPRNVCEELQPFATVRTPPATSLPTCHAAGDRHDLCDMLSHRGRGDAHYDADLLLGFALGKFTEQLDAAQREGAEDQQ